MMNQYMEIKNAYKDYILFYRLGDFYEMFFEDAVTASRELEIVLTGRNCGLDEKAPLCGIPYHSLEGYLSKLVGKGYKVAICEQIEDPKHTKGIVKRGVVRVVTPGTVIDPGMLDDKTNNYVMSLYLGRDISIAYADITTGELKSTVFKTNEIDIYKALEEISKVKPSEIIVSEVYLDETKFKSFDMLHQRLLDELKSSYMVTKFNDPAFKTENATDAIKRIYNVFTVEGLGLTKQSEQISAIGGLLGYIEDTQKVELLHFTNVESYNYDNFMVLDKFTRRNLELTETMRDGKKKGSVLWVLDKTSTSMGGRRLKKWIEQPLLDIEKIRQRHMAVETLYDNLFLREELKDALRNVYDLERLSSKLVYGNANARDLVALKSSILLIPDIKSLISGMETGMLNTLNSEIDLLEDIYELINTSVAEEPSIGIKDGGIIKNGFNADLDELRDIVKNGKQWLLNIETRERERTGIKTLKIGFNKVFGYYIDVTRANSHLVPEEYIRKQTLSNSERYITPELKDLEDKILSADEKIVNLEHELFVNIRGQVLTSVNRIKDTAEAIGKLDVLVAFAQVSYTNNYTKPKMTKDKTINIKNGRHPVVERLMTDEQFISNDTILNDKDDKFYIITGPNMAGKSTYLRQVALINLIAQIGCFVPAESCEIGITDRIFTRVGASDDLAQGQSTFMVEMSELANILHNATENSLIILDEIGRGTSTYDGLSIAWSVVEFLTEESGIGAKTMFATHYHELTELEGKFSGVKNYRISVKESGDNIVFLRKIERGGASKSYGIQVAKIAGVPEKVIARAKVILEKLEESDINNNINNLRDLDVDKNVDKNKDNGTYTEKEIIVDLVAQTHTQLSLFGGDDSHRNFVEELSVIDINSLTPMEAMNELYALVKKAKNFN
jgi:DNA mismatch repair protein MutS